MSPERQSKKKQPEVPDAVARVSLWYPAATHSYVSTDSYYGDTQIPDMFTLPRRRRGVR